MSITTTIRNGTLIVPVPEWDGPIEIQFAHDYKPSEPKRLRFDRFRFVRW